MLDAPLRNSSDTSEMTTPHRVQMCRRPSRRLPTRGRERSENAPASGLTRIATSAPRPVTQPRAVSLPSTPRSEICCGSRTCTGVKNTIQSPRFAAKSRPIQDLFTGTAGSASATGAPCATAIEPPENRARTRKILGG
jgi:hypothetical protein